MSDYPVLVGDDFHGPCITSYDTIQSIGATFMASNVNASGATFTWPTANRAIYVPFVSPVDLVVVKMFVENGATVNGNVDIGVYDMGGNQVAAAGSTVQAGTSTIQIIDTADFTLVAGRYYMALASSSATSTFARSGQPGAAVIGAMGVLQQASAFALPATATFAANAFTSVPMFGLAMITGI